ncbi:MAG: BppU family phage baseplate upper protein [Peptostreptococcaceae bacterium]|nr:BppU family phage baseplate upper protein [Peptostreptococcaceae bacterium]
MAQIYNRLTLDVKKKNHDIITAVQKDARSRFLDINLIDNGVNIDLTGHEVRLYAKKPDQTEVFNNGRITNAAQGRVQIELTSQLLAKEGYVEAQVITYKNNQQILSTLPFRIHVVSNLMSDNAIESSNEYGALVILYQNLYEAYDLMTTMIQKIGTPGTNAQELNLDTMFKVWDWLVQYMRQNSSAGVMDAITRLHTKADSIITQGQQTHQKLGMLDTISGKLNSQTDPLNYLIYIQSIVAGESEYILENETIWKDFMMNSSALMRSYRASNSIKSKYMNFTGSERRIFLKKVIDSYIGNKGMWRSMFDGQSGLSYFLSAETETDIIRMFFNDPAIIERMKSDEIDSKYLLFGHREISEATFQRIMRVLKNIKPDFVKWLFNKRVVSMSGTSINSVTFLGINESQLLWTKEHAKDLYRIVKANPSRFQRVYQGMMSQKEIYGSRKGFYVGDKIDQRASQSSVPTEVIKNLEENYIVFFRPDKWNSTMQNHQKVGTVPNHTIGSNFKGFKHIQFSKSEVEGHRRDNQPLSESDPLGFGTGNITVALGEENTMNNNNYFYPSEYYSTYYIKPYCEVYRIL